MSPSSSRVRARSLFAALVASGSAVAACGGGASQPVPPSPSTAESVANPHGASSAAPRSAMRVPQPTAMAAELQAIGLDPKNLPPLDKVPPDKMRPLMMTFKKATGMDCKGCHDVNNFKASTPHKRLAEKMWDEFVRGLAFEDGSPVYCDSCHGGQKEFLERRDKKALATWMDENYVTKLKRAGDQAGKSHSCETCHGDPFQPTFLEAWEGKKH